MSPEKIYQKTTLIKRCGAAGVGRTVTYLTGDTPSTPGAGAAPVGLAPAVAGWPRQWRY